MAGKSAQGTVDVILDANGASVMAAIKNAENRIKQISKITGEIAQKAEAAAKAFSNANFVGFNKMLRDLEAVEKRLLTASRGKALQGDQDRLFAGRVVRGNMAPSLREANSLATVFSARLSEIDGKIAKLGNQGRVDRKLISRRLGIEEASKDVAKLERELSRIDRLAARTPGMNADRSGVNAAMAGLFAANKRRKGDLSAELALLRREADAYIAAVKAEQARINRELSAGAGAGAGGGKGLFGNMGLQGVFLRTAAYGGAAAAIYGVVGAVKDGTVAAIQFEDQLAKISAVAGLTSTQNEKLGNTIREIGRTSRFATQDIAEATMVLAQAGFTADDIKDSLQGVANLASAAGVTFSEATDVITSAIGAFQLQASETQRITDILASALNNTKLNIQQVALGIQYAGATAYENKISFEELTAVMATMAQAGIRSGSTIGTGLRQFLVDLQTPTKKMTDEFTKLGLTMEDIDVKTLGLPEVLRRLAEAGFSSANAYRVLETRATAAYLVLKNNRDEILKQIAAQNQQGLAAQAAARGQNSLAAEWQRFKNILNESVANGIEPATTALKDLLRTYNDMKSDKTRGALMEQLRTAETAEEMSRLRREILAYDEALRTTSEIEGYFAAAIEATTTRANESVDAFNRQEHTIQSVEDAIHKLVIRKGQLKNGSLELQAETNSLIGRFQGLASQLLNVAGTYDNLVLAMQRYQRQAIAIGAQQATMASIEAVNKANTLDRKGSAYATAFRDQGGVRRLPKHLQDAFYRFVRNPSDVVAGTALLNHSVQNPNKLPGPLINLLRNTVGNKSGASAAGKEALRLQGEAGKLGMLGGRAGQQYLQRVGSLSSEGDVKAFMREMQDKASRSTNPDARNAFLHLFDTASRMQGSFSSPQGPESKAGGGGGRKGRGGGDREEDRKLMTLMRERMKATSAELDNAIKGLMDTKLQGVAETVGDETIVSGGSRELTKEKILANLKRAEGSLEEWIKHRLDLMNAQIDSGNMTGEEAEMVKAEVEREIAEKRKEFARKIEEGLVTAMETMVEVVEKIKERAEAAADHVLGLSEARLSALDRSSLRGRVPDYVKNFYGRRSEEAKDARDRAQIGINQQTIAGLQQQRTFWGGVFDETDLPGKADGFITKLQELDDQILQLTRDNELLIASFQGEALLPQTFGQSMRMAIEEFKEINGLNRSINEQLAFEIPNALEGAYTGFQQFFTDILTGTKTVESAFRDFVKSMIAMLMQMVAKFIAMQVFKLILSAVGGGVSPGGGGMDALTASSNAYFGLYHGGRVKGAYRGEYIKDGHPGRDSTLRRLAKGEFVTRKAAVDSVGEKFMHDLNQRGAAALRPQSIIAQAPAKQEMSVYIVRGEDKPQLGPNDVLMIWQDDVLKDGASKKLIRYIAQGG